MSAELAKRLNITPLAKYVAGATAGLEPAVMGLGPIYASRKALNRAGLTVNDIGLVELNEAFASQSLECIRQLELDEAKVNVNGGAIALGHPLGASGARILTTLLYENEKTKCRIWPSNDVYWVGQGIAAIIENVTE